MIDQITELETNEYKGLPHWYNVRKQKVKQQLESEENETPDVAIIIVNYKYSKKEYDKLKNPRNDGKIMNKMLVDYKQHWYSNVEDIETEVKNLIEFDWRKM